MLRVGVICVLNIMLVAENSILLNLSRRVCCEVAVEKGAKKLSTRVETGKFGEQKVSAQPGFFVKEKRRRQGCKAASISHNTLWNLIKFTYSAHVRLRLVLF